MKITKRTLVSLVLISILSVFWSCESNKPGGAIVGTWDAVSLKKDTSLITERLELVKIQFLENGRYSYTGGIEYKEAGRFEYRKDRLIMQDTLKPDREAIALNIKAFSEDTLCLLMKGVDKQLKELSFVRQK